MKIYEELQARGLIAQVTDEETVRNLVNEGKATFYIGFDPTADSLHVGHFMALCLMKRLQMAGNKPIALLGGGTGMIGDPSGKTDMRKMLTKEQIAHNIECFKKQMARFIDFSDGKALIVNNADWLLDLNYVELLREVGPHFSVNRMLTAECYKQRMERGLTFLEFNYMIMQSYDFYKLFQDYGCNMQFGGDDQWANMLGGTELIRKKLGKDAYAMTITLLLNSEGKKMGKTEKGAVWLDPEKTSPYDFFQYWRNVADADVVKCLKMLTFVPIEKIEAMEAELAANGDGKAYPEGLKYGNQILPVNRTEKRTVIADEKMIRISGTKVKVGSGGCTRVGLSQKEIQTAKDRFFKTHPNKKSPSDSAFLIAERKPLLMLHIIETDLDEEQSEIKSVPQFLFALGVGFPDTGAGVKKANYVVNMVDLKNWMDPEEDEDD